MEQDELLSEQFVSLLKHAIEQHFIKDQEINKQNNSVIIYTTSTEEIITPNVLDGWGSNIIENYYK